jgi:hypothetical protein
MGAGGWRPQVMDCACPVGDISMSLAVDLDQAFRGAVNKGAGYFFAFSPLSTGSFSNTFATKQPRG